MKKSSFISPLLRENDWQFSALDRQARAILLQQPQPPRAVHPRKLFLAATAPFLFGIGIFSMIYLYMVYATYENIVSGQYIYTRGGWTVIGGPIFILVLILLAYYNYYVVRRSIISGVIAVARIDHLTTQQRNAQIHGKGVLQIYSSRGDFSIDFTHQTVSNQWLSQVRVSDYLLVLLHSSDNRILEYFGPLIEEDEPLIHAIVQQKLAHMSAQTVT